MALRMKVSVVCNVFVAVMTFVALVLMMVGFGSEHSLLQSAGIHNLKYFTVLSNLFSGVVSAVFAIALVRSRGAVSRALLVLKLMATTSVAVTFFTVVVLFEIVFGLRGMFLGANFWYHLVLPVVSMVEFCVLDTGVLLPFPTTLFGCIPTALYGIVYFANILINGIGEWPTGNDWYGFLSWGMDAAPIVFAVMIVSTWIIAIALWGINRLASRRR